VCLSEACKESLYEARDAQNKREVAVELNTLANLYRQAGQPQKGVAACNEALQIEQLAGGRRLQALSPKT
jgi:hypothetical protein